jgi:hypothetical protein
VGLSVRRSISILAIVTEKFREEFKAELQEAITTTQHRIDQMDFQSRRFLADLQATDLTQAMNARRQIEAEKRRHEALKQELSQQLSEADTLELGSEFPRGTIEGNVELEVGDDLMQKVAGASLVVKDGVVIEIREA